MSAWEELDSFYQTETPKNLFVYYFVPWIKRRVIRHQFSNLELLCVLNCCDTSILSSSLSILTWPGPGGLKPFHTYGLPLSTPGLVFIKIYSTLYRFGSHSHSKLLLQSMSSDWQSVKCIANNNWKQQDINPEDVWAWLFVLIPNSLCLFQQRIISCKSLLFTASLFFHNCQTLAPNPLVPNPKQRDPGLTLKSYGPPHRLWLLHIDFGSPNRLWLHHIDSGSIT